MTLTRRYVLGATAPSVVAESLVATAKESGDAHSIKLGEATRSEHALRGDTNVVAALNSWLG